MRIQRNYTLNASSESSAPDLSLLEPLFQKYSEAKGSLIPLLQGAQKLYGYIPAPAFSLISSYTGIPVADIYGVTTFYSQFRLHPVGKNIIRVCHGTACHVQNANALTDAIKGELNVKDGGTTDDGLFTLESVACLGCCSLAPVMMIGENTYGKLTGKDAVKVIRELKNNSCTNKK